MRKWIALVIGWLLTLNLNAQSGLILRGTVVDAETGLPLANSSAFFNNTILGTVSDTAGRFSISEIPPGQYELIVSCVGYQTAVYQFSSSQLPLRLRVKLHQKATELDEVTVMPYEKDGWQKWGKYFIENFIGTSEFAADCRLLNPEVLRFRVLKHPNRLEATANEPLLLENKALGYLVHYQLQTFVNDFSQKLLTVIGYPFFEPLKPRSNSQASRWAANRQKAYRGSILHYMRSLYNNRLKEEGFDVLRFYRKPNLEKKRVASFYRAYGLIQYDSAWLSVAGRDTNDLADSSAYYQAVLRQPDYKDSIGRSLLNADSLLTGATTINKSFHFTNYLLVIYTKAREEKAYLDFWRTNRRPELQQSTIWLQDKTITIDPNGSYYNPTDLVSMGYWGWSEKMARSLPLTYAPGAP